MKIVKAMVIIFALMSPVVTHAAPTYLQGNIINITSGAGGLQIMFDTGVPDNCAGVPYNWMRIREENKTMISVALIMWATGNLNAVVYTNPLAGGACDVNQLDPAN